MITEYQGDLLGSNCNIILHQSNCFSKMGAGIAKQIKERYPEAYRADCQFMMGQPPIQRLGNFSYARAQDGRIIMNLYGQYRYGRERQHTDYAALESAINQAFQFIKKNYTYPIVGIPKNMGCNNAGGDWSIVYKIIYNAACIHGVHVNLYQYELGR